ncbi:MAG: bifunctional (p)ppGpp synthetase/guanosine-3',5'-bis(diphosphate) 3'-pyrophosphohydrolase [Bacilli bacterium]|nr:bifunctional (p)ppGpp synthetase/guanosine-3',5'-bis(diphosphate) 3'-pyrophosphohydrolase [Bacilli bacterium]
MTKKIFDNDYSVLYNKVKEYITDLDQLNLIKEAYNYVDKLYEGQTRLTGDPYISHPLNVALILSEIKADYQTICAGLLHDVIEVGEIEKQELINKFGEEITSLVSGVTKINKLKLKGGTNLSVANHRKILVGLSEDVRVIIIKLSDRLHNMRTLYVLPRDRQKAKAKETLDILTPIAHRLGMSHIKGELEDLSLRYLKPDAYFSIVEKLNQTKLERDKCVKEMINSVSSILNENNIKHEIKGRSKSIYSIYKKLDRGKKFSDIFDLLALRVFVDTKEECYQTLGLIHAIYKPLPKRFKDYIAMPKTNMYQSLHTTVIGIDGNLFEVQIRTYEMDKIAEHGIAAHWSYKEQGSNIKASMQNEMEQKLQFFRNMIEIQNEEDDESFVNIVKEELFKENVYVFTKDGDVIELPIDSTPIDFAYRLHTNIGDHLVGAIVNGNIVSLDYKLKDNDVIKINTNNNSNGPSREWLNIVKTNHAKNKIKNFFNKIEKDEAKNIGLDELNKEIKKRKISNSDFYKEDNIKQILDYFKFKNIDELYTNLGLKKIGINQIFNVIESDNITKEEMILKKVMNNNLKKVAINKHDIIVSGIDDIKVNIASCCSPVPKDNIVGFITRGNGVSIHRSICPNIKDDENRLIDVSWNENLEKKYQTSIMIYCNHTNNILLEIVNKSSNTDIIIQSMNTIRSGNNTMYEVSLLVKNIDDLNKFISSIQNIGDVINVERIIR